MILFIIARIRTWLGRYRPSGIGSVQPNGCVMEEKKEDEVVVSSSWFGNLLIAAAVVIILGAALAYKEFFG